MSAGRIICIRDSRGEDPLPCGFSPSQPSGPLGLPLTPPPASALGEGAGRNSGGLTVGPQSRRWVSVTWAGGGCSLAHTYTALEKTQWKWSSTRAPQGKVTVLLSGSGRESRELSAHQRVPLTPPCRPVSPKGTGTPTSPPPKLVPSPHPAWLTIATSPPLPSSCSRGTDWIRQGPGFLQSVFDLHHLLPSDQGIPADVWQREFEGTRITPGSLFVFQTPHKHLRTTARLLKAHVGHGP